MKKRPSFLVTKLCLVAVVVGSRWRAARERVAERTKRIFSEGLLRCGDLSRLLGDWILKAGIVNRIPAPLQPELIYALALPKSKGIRLTLPYMC
mmetsp:Transcript_2253/g.4783  ORF Transcript_2253/g.4783 Transcript_2253/m.4783 type:complete len:94 (-) Transcript_2253:257-538(-)